MYNSMWCYTQQRGSSLQVLQDGAHNKNEEEKMNDAYFEIMSYAQNKGEFRMILAMVGIALSSGLEEKDVENFKSKVKSTLREYRELPE